MEKNNIAPEKITKPIQLLAAWLVGLLAVDGSFLIAATRIDLASWQSGALTVAAILNVPVFIGALFLLQTKFRPELQEDSYYSTYLNSKSNEVMRVPKAEMLHEQLLARISILEGKLTASKSVATNGVLSKLNYGINQQLDEAIERNIENKLDELGVNLIRTFGESSDRPKSLVVGVSGSLEKEVRNQVLLMAKEVGFEHYSTIEPYEEIEEDVLFGAYGDPEGKISLKVPKAG